MFKRILITSVATLSLATLAHAGLKPGDKLSAYEIKNVETGKQYCQVCAYGAKKSKAIAFGKVSDEAFWSDLKKLQKLQDQNPEFAVYAHVFDTEDAAKVRATAEKHGIKFPVVITAEKAWNNKYKVDGVSRTIYYAKGQTVAWSGVGLDDQTVATLKEKVQADLRG